MKEIEIVAYQCKKCGKIHYPYHDRCLECKGREFDQIQPQGKCKLLTFTRIYNLPWGFDQRYLVIGVAEFENGIRAMGQINVDESVPLEIGMSMQPSWEPVRVQAGEEDAGVGLARGRDAALDVEARARRELHARAGRDAERDAVRHADGGEHADGVGVPVAVGRDLAAHLDQAPVLGGREDGRRRRRR